MRKIKLELESFLGKIPFVTLVIEYPTKENKENKTIVIEKELYFNRNIESLLKYDKLEYLQSILIKNKERRMSFEEITHFIYPIYINGNTNNKILNWN